MVHRKCCLSTIRTAALAALWTLAAGHAGATQVSDGTLAVQFDTKSGHFAIADTEAGTVLTDGYAIAQAGAAEVDTRDTSRVTAVEERDNPAGPELVVWYRSDVRFVFRVRGAESRVEITASMPDEANIARARARMQMGPDPLIGRLLDQKPGDGGVLTTTLGPANIPSARSLFDRRHDVAVTVGAADDRARLTHELGAPADRYDVVSSARSGELLLAVTVRKHYYRDTLGIAHYAPLSKSGFFRTAPCVAMTWYGLPGWGGRPAQTKERLFPQIDWVARNLRPYAPDLVFQLDDNYAVDDATMRAISDYIRSRGMIPGVWSTPYTAVPAAAHDSHPEWFLHDANGGSLRTFGGIIFASDPYAGHTLDVGNPEAMEQAFLPWWRRMCDTWGFDFFKIDGQPNVIDAYRAAHGPAGVEAYRRGLDAARDVVGPERFINGCWGIPLEAIGKVDGSRTGGDTGQWPHATDVIIRWNFLNNTAWWCDPDAAANLADAEIERVRLNTQARALTGQQFLTDEVWTRVRPDVAHAWQRGMPNADIRPANLYEVPDWQRYDVFDLKVERPFGRWDVVGVLNYSADAKARDLRLADLDLEPGDYHVYDFWQQDYTGRLAATDSMPVHLDAYEGRLFAIHRDTGAPAVLSTSRHITQGGIDLGDVHVSRDGTGWRIDGCSEQLVHGDPYAISVLTGPYRVISAWSDVGTASWTEEGEVTQVTLVPEGTTRAAWAVRLAPVRGPRLRVSPRQVALRPGDAGAQTLRIANAGPGEARWRAWSDSPWISPVPGQGIAGPYPSHGTVELRADPAQLPRHGVREATIWFRAEGHPGQPPQAVRIRFTAPSPPNLALSAKATSSSDWSADYSADKVNDGRADTRWNSAKGDRDGAWIALEWPAAVVCDSVTIHEAPDLGTRVRAWALEAWDGSAWSLLAEGGGIGAEHAATFTRRSTTRLRLTIRSASDVPTLPEVEVYDRGD